MSAEGIFLRSGDGLTVLKQTGYDSEAILQTALAQYPEFLAGPTTTGDDEARLLLIRREMQVPGGQEKPGTFSLDHLFVDAEGVPVLVEVKRSSDTRIRREVVGQMLDYAANAVKYWPLISLQQSLAQTAAEENTSPEELIEELHPGLDPDEFWRTVETNLKAGRVRLIFVADRLPEELVRIIEFLNEQMNPAEVLGVELQQFTSSQHTVYVPRLVGRTSGAVMTKSGGSGSGQQWHYESFFAAAEGRCSPEEVALMRQLVDDVERRGHRINWGRGITPGLSGWYRIDGRPAGVWSINANNESPSTRAYLVLYFADLLPRLGVERIEKAARRLEELPHLTQKIQDARQSGWKKYPSLYLADVAGDQYKEQVLLDAIGQLLTEA
ncbi:MAG: hypothetical protein JWO67_5539 [Streptosporangiaceae bacterium]|nr:hypothetical protein [Streptosporangiaceae bacterium]